MTPNVRAQEQRTIGLRGATGVGVGAIVGGGIFVLAGAAYAETGAGATLAFALNAVLAYVAVFSFAELATRFPENGGTYVYAKKVLSVRSAFATGWVLWFAHIVTAVLYALGFATFATIALSELLGTLGREQPAWIRGRQFPFLLAAIATIGYSLAMARRSGSGGQWANTGKILVFLVILAAGAWALVRQPIADTVDAATPFLPGGVVGLTAAMGFTFITLQGCGLIAAVAGEIKDPSRTIPRAMFVSLTIAVSLYVPLVFLVAVVGVGPGGSIQKLAQADPDAAVVAGIRHFMGDVGYWLVLIAAILATLSALSANLLAGSRVALSMARDRTLPVVLGQTDPKRGTPVFAVYATSLTVLAILLMVRDVAAAGAAASLIFLVAYVLTHITAYLTRLRGSPVKGAFRSPLFPVVPLVGAVSSGAVAAFQAIRVPQAGAIALLWLALGVLLYFVLFKGGAEARDESAEGLDPDLVRLRGKNPLVLVPIANPAHARSMVEIAHVLAPSESARVLLLTIVPPPGEGEHPLAGLADAQRVVKEALETSFAAGHAPVAMISAAPPWEEIRRVAVQHDCQSLLLGLGSVGAGDGQLETLINSVDCDIAILSAHSDWQLVDARRVLVAIGGRGDEHGLRARVLGSLRRDSSREVTFMTVCGPEEDPDEIRRDASSLAEQLVPGAPVKVVQGADPAHALIEAGADYDLLVLGIQTVGWGRKSLGEVAIRIAKEAPCATMLLGRRRTPLPEALLRPVRDAVTAALTPADER